ncbi:hypothetical protein FRB99_006246 [Tulasnella sp. 403]|nr:hypothetical protein FRB99_006246 [Tulasnella sp. 403]
MPKYYPRLNTATLTLSNAPQRQHPSAPHVARYHAADQRRREFTPSSTDEAAIQHLRELLPPLEFPSKEFVRRMITHASWKAGIEGHNTRLGFIGRRVLNSYLILFLHDARQKARSAAAASDSEGKVAKEVDYEAIVDFVLDSYQLGGHVGKAWRVDNIMRWIPAVPENADEKAKKTGVNAVRATTVEAIVGGVYHEFGATAAHRLFHTRILPYLKPLLDPSVQPYVDEFCDVLGGRRAAILPAASSYDTTGQHASNAIPPPDAQAASPLRRASVAA